MGSCSGRFIAFAQATGDELWSYNTLEDGAAATFHGDVLVTAALVIVGTDGPPTGWLYAFERAGGGVRWKHPFARGVAAQVLGSDGLAFAVGGDGKVAAFEAATGRLAWSTEYAPPAEHEWALNDPALAGDLLLVAWPSGEIVALERRSGERRWSVAIGTQTTSPAVWGGAAWVGGADGRLRRLDLLSGQVLASVETAGRPYGDLQAAAGCLLVLSASDVHSLTCHDPTSGAVRWRHGGESEISTFRPLVHGDEVVLGHKGWLIALSLADGAERWRCPLGGVPRGLSSAGGRLFVGSLAGTIWAIPETACRDAPPATR